MTGTEVIEEAIRILLGSSREEMNKLAVDAPAGSGGTTTLSFQYPLGGIREGAQIVVNHEMFRVWSVDDSAKTAEVERAIQGTTEFYHVASDLVYVNPRFPRFAVFKAMNDELVSLSSPSNGLFRIVPDEFEFNAGTSEYALEESVIDVYDVKQETVGPATYWPRMPHWTFNSEDTTVHIPYGVPGRNIRALTKVGFSPIDVDDLNEEVAETSGLPVEAEDILSLGILMRLGPSREIKRNFTEAQSGDSRRAEEVQAGAVTQSFAWVRNQRKDRIIEERLRLERLYPPKRAAR